MATEKKTPDLMDYRIGEGRQLSVFLVGKSGLLQDNASAGYSTEPEVPEPGKKKKKAANVMTDEDATRIAATATYKDAKGYYHPGAALRSAVIEAVKNSDLVVGRVVNEDGVVVKPGKSIASTGVFLRNFFVVGDKMYLVHPKTKRPLTKYEIDRRTAVNAQGGRIPVARAHWPVWACEAIVEYDETVLHETNVIQAINLAGHWVGFGVLRPMPPRGPRKGTGGPFGRFRVESFNGI